MAQTTVQARPRTVVGKKVKTLRRKGILPANIYGHNRPSQALELDAHAFSLLQRHLPPNAIVDLAVEGARPRLAMIHRTQRDVRTGQAIHVEFFQVNPREKLTASVPIALVGEPEVVKRGEALLLHEMTTIEVSCLPSDLPGAIEADISHLQAPGDTVLVRDLVFDRSRIETKAHPDDQVVVLAKSQAYEEPVTPAEPAAEQAPDEETAAPEAEGEGEA